MQESVWDYPRPAIAEPTPRPIRIVHRGVVLADGAQVTPQPGGFYVGWITACEAGPFKGSPASLFW